MRRIRLTQRPKVTLTVLAGLFMALLDVFIVNIAFPAIPRERRVQLLLERGVRYSARAKWCE